MDKTKLKLKVLETSARCCDLSNKKKNIDLMVWRVWSWMYTNALDERIGNILFDDPFA